MPAKSKWEYYSEEELKDFYLSSSSFKEMFLKMGYSRYNTQTLSQMREKYNWLTPYFKGKDLKGNISDLVNAQINQGKNLDSNIGNIVSLGQNNISNTNVNNSINQNPINTYESQSDKFPFCLNFYFNLFLTWSLSLFYFLMSFSLFLIR